MAAQALDQFTGNPSGHRPLAPRPPGGSFPSDTLADTIETGGGAVNERDQGSRRPTKRTRVACQHCRQSKLRCGGSNGGTQPCRRCSELSRSCVFDTRYKRVSKRTTLNDLADHVEMLKAAGGLTRRENSGPSPTTARRASQLASPDSQTSPTSMPGVSEGTEQEEPQPGLRDWPNDSANTVLDNDYASGPGLSLDGQMPSSIEPLSTIPLPAAREIGTIRLSSLQVRQTFQIYYSFYHPSFPVIPSSVSADRVYKSSPLLFWTIIVTASRHDSVDFSLLQTLIPAVKELLWSTIANVPHTLPSLQSMAILCVWGFPVASMPLDINFVLSGILKSAATHVGLHRPDILTHYSRTRISLKSNELLQAIKVWCCIYVAIEGVAVGNGYQPFLLNDRTIERASAESNPYELPESLHLAVITQVFCNKVHSAMESIDGSETAAAQSCRSSLLSLFESNLRELENRLNKYTSHKKSMFLLSACFQLRAYWLFDDDDSTSRREGVLKAFDAAVQFVHSLQRGETAGSPARYLTFLHLRVCITAAIFISKVVHSSYGQYVSKEVGKQTFNYCISIFKRSSVEDNDMDGRTTKVLVQLWSIHAGLAQELPQSPPRISLKSRSFLSIAHDGLWEWRERYHGQPSNGAPKFPPPVITPEFTEAPGEPLAADGIGQSTLLQSGQAGMVGQSTDGFNHLEASASEIQQLPSPRGFPVADPTREPWIAGCEQDNLAADDGSVNPDVMDFDLLFPDLNMAFTNQNWLQSMSKEM